jgi:type I restriction enzyme M protein
MLDTQTKKRIDDCRDILVGKLPDPKAQIEQITIGLIYKFMDDMDKEAIELGGAAKFFSGDYAKYAWDKLFDTKVTATEMLRLYSDAIESMEKNPNIPQLFRDIFNNAYLPYRDPETLKLFLKTIGEFEYTHSEKLGDAFEYLLSVMGSQGDAGQFRTPRHIIDFLVAIVDPDKGETILDPACGTAGFLISTYKHILLKHTKANKAGLNIFEYNKLEKKPFNNLGDQLTPDDRKKLIQNFAGYDISPDMVRLSLVNLYLHGFSDPHINEYDTLSSEDRWNENFDVVMANPPFMTPKGGIRPHKRFTVNSNRAEVLFVDYIIEHLNRGGKAGIVVPEGILIQTGTAFKEVRQMLVSQNLWCIVNLPSRVFSPYSGIKTAILLLDKEISKKSKCILNINITNDGYNLGANRTPIKGSQLPAAIEEINLYRNQILNETKITISQSNLIEKSKILLNPDTSLNAARYQDNILSNSEFEFVPLGDLCDLLNGYAFKSKDYIDSSNTLNVRMSNIRPNSGFDIDYNPRFLPDSYATEYARYQLQDGDIIIAMTDMASDPKILGVPTIVKADGRNFLLNQRVGKFTDIDESRLYKPYLKHILNNTIVREYYKSLGGGGLQVNIGKKDILTLKIPLPTLDKQIEIVNQIDSQYNEISDFQRRINETEMQIENDISKIWGEVGV